MRKLIAAVLAVASVVSAVGAYALTRSGDGAPGQAFEMPRATDEDAKAFADARVFFAHQSVGFNILSGIPEVYLSRSLQSPSIVEGLEPTDQGIAQVPIGVNGDPLGKISAFEADVRAGVGEHVDVAVLKLCYVDIVDGSDVEGIFAAYRATIDALQRDYPQVIFVVATEPVTAERRVDQRVRAFLGRKDGLGPEQNVARERFNTLIRQTYGASGRLFDIAAIESTAPSGERIGGTYKGAQYEAMYNGYAADAGHLNAEGSVVAADAFVAVIGRALRSRTPQ